MPFLNNILQVLKQLLKWMSLSVISFLLLILIAGLSYRLFMPEVPEPMGEMIDMDGYQLHILQAGEKNDLPTLVIEGGGGLSTEFYHWLSEDLKEQMRVVRYDRIGIGKSDALDAPRDPETVARQLHVLLEKAGESPPYLMMGHSTGGPQIRVFTELYPDEVEGMFFLDATHPDHVERYNAPKETSFKYKGYLASIEILAVLCDLGIFPLYDQVFGTPYYGPGLPDSVNQSFKTCLRNGKAFRAYKEETRDYYRTLERSGRKEDFGSLPIRAFHAVPEDPVERASKRKQIEKKIKQARHKEYADLSSNGKSFEIPGNHVSIFTEQKNAAIICKEVLKLLDELGY